MAVALLLFTCIACRRPDTGNPHKVPSVRVKMGANGLPCPNPNGTREPLCRNCAATLNAKRVEAGLTPFPIHEDAYQAADETE